MVVASTAFSKSLVAVAANAIVVVEVVERRKKKEK
jgi:hypothetical protein